MKLDITDFKGIVTNADLDDLPSGVLDDLCNFVIQGGKLVKTFLCEEITAVDSVQYKSTLQNVGRCDIDTSYGTIAQVVLSEVLDKADTEWAAEGGGDTEHFIVGQSISGESLLFVAIAINASTGRVSLYDMHDATNNDSDGLGIAIDDFYHKVDRNPVINDKNILRVYPGNVSAMGVNESKPIWFGHIEREFFWGAKTVNQLVVKEANITHDYTISSVKTSVSENDTGLATGHRYSYKIVPIFDGLQEALLPDGQTNVNLELEKDDVDVDVCKAVNIEYTFDISNWNPRITGFNIYRSSDSVANYRKITTILTLSKDEDKNRIGNIDSLDFGRAAYITGVNWTTDEHKGKVLNIKYPLRGEVQKIGISGNTADILYLSHAVNRGVWDEKEENLWGNSNNIFRKSGQSVLWSIDGEVEQEVDVYDWDLGQFQSPGIGLDNNISYREYLYSQPNGVKYITSDTYSLSPNTEYRVSLIGRSVNYVNDNEARTSLILHVKVGSEDFINLIGSKTIKSVDYETSSGTFTTDSTGNVKFRIAAWKTGVNVDINFAIKGDIEIEKSYASGEKCIYAGKSIGISSDLNLNLEDAYGGYKAAIGGGVSRDINIPSGIYKATIEENVTRAIRFDKAPGKASVFPVGITKNYLWETIDSDTVLLDFSDNGLADGANHYLEGEVSIDVNAEFTEQINGTFYHLNLILDPLDKAEVQDGWVAKSVNGMPDVNPVSNVLKLDGSEGLAGTGLAGQFGSLIVFFEHKIYKIMLSNTGEFAKVKSSMLNTGNIAKEGLVSVGEDIYYIAKNGIYKLHLNIGTEADESPLLKNRISEPINDLFMAISDKRAIEGIYNQNTDELVYKFSAGVIWAFNIEFDYWRRIDVDFDMDFMKTMSTGECLFFDKTEGDLFNSDEAINATTNNLNKASVKTKWFSITEDRDYSKIIRSIITTYKSGTDLQLNLYFDYSSSPAFSFDLVNSVNITKKLSSVRARTNVFAIEIIEKAVNVDNVEINKLSVEVV